MRDAVDAERPPRLAIAVTRDEVPTPAGVHDLQRLHAALRLGAVVRAIAKANSFRTSTSSGQGHEHAGVDRGQLALRKLRGVRADRVDLFAESHGQDLV